MDPYKILGVPPTATEEEIKKAYKTLAKKYHPDMHAGAPDQQEWEKKFKTLQEAYNMIMDQKQHGGSYGSAGQGGYGGYGGGYTNYGGYGGYRSYGGFGPFGSFYGSRSNRSSNESPQVQAAERYVNNGMFREALNVLDDIPQAQRTARWYYLSALSHSGLGDNLTAKEHAQRAAQMDPTAPEYRYLAQQLAGGGSAYHQRSSNYSGTVCGSSGCLSCLCFNLLLNSFCRFCYCPI